MPCAWFHDPEEREGAHLVASRSLSREPRDGDAHPAATYIGLTHGFVRVHTHPTHINWDAHFSIKP